MWGQRRHSCDCMMPLIAPGVELEVDYVAQHGMWCTLLLWQSNGFGACQLQDFSSCMEKLTDRTGDRSSASPVEPPNSCSNCIIRHSQAFSVQYELLFYLYPRSSPLHPISYSIQMSTMERGGKTIYPYCPMKCHLAKAPDLAFDRRALPRGAGGAAPAQRDLLQERLIKNPYSPLISSRDKMTAWYNKKYYGPKAEGMLQSGVAVGALLVFVVLPLWIERCSSERRKRHMVANANGKLREDLARKVYELRLERRQMVEQIKAERIQGISKAN